MPTCSILNQNETHRLSYRPKIVKLIPFLYLWRCSLNLKDELSNLTNLFSEEESEILKSHLYVRGYKAHIKQKAIYEIITKNRETRLQYINMYM